MGLEALVNNYPITQAMNILRLLLTEDTNLHIKASNYKFSIANYLLKKRLLDKLALFIKNSIIHPDLDFYRFRLLDLGAFSIEEHSEISKFLNITKYQEAYHQQQAKDEAEKSKRDAMLTNYAFHNLLQFCIDDYLNVTPETIFFAYGRDEIESALDKNALTLASPMADIVDKFNKPLLIDNIAALKHFIRMSKFKTLNKASFADVDLNSHKKNEIYFDESANTYQEFLFISGKKQWDNTDPRFRLIRLASKIESLDSPKFRKMIATDHHLKEAVFLGKNFSHYATLYVKDTSLLQWVYRVFGAPESHYGLTTLDALYMIYFYEPKYGEHIKRFKQQFPAVTLSEEIYKTVKKHHPTGVSIR